MDKTTPRGVLAAVITAALMAFAICGAIRCLEQLAFGCDDVCTVATAIRRLQPAADEERAAALAAVFVEAGREAAIDPLLLVAIAMRESSLSERVERLERLGAVGELGLMQIHPQGPALRLRPQECSAELEGARCQVRTGARWLAFVRERCPGTTWRWVAAYGLSRCPSEEEARVDRNALRAESLYARARGNRF